MDKTQLEQDAVTAIGKTGVPVTPLLRDITMAAIDTARRQRTPDYPLHSLIKDAVHTTVAHAGPRRAVSAMEQNERMAALRPFGLDVPTNPSVQDVAVAVLELCVEGAVREALVRRTTRRSNLADPRMN